MRKHCICNGASSETMAICSDCRNRFHIGCVNLNEEDINERIMHWVGPCCSSILAQQQQEEIDLTTDNGQ
jgi:uncharacterized cysteine cluster protein YcgN (CxxCxxCC family)